jgi:hypothetical protein
VKRYLAWMALLIAMAGGDFSVCFAMGPQIAAPYSKKSDSSAHIVASAQATAGALSASLGGTANQWTMLDQVQITCTGGSAVQAFTVAGAATSLVFEVNNAVNTPIIVTDLRLMASAEGTAFTCTATVGTAGTCSCNLVGSVEAP